MSGSAQTPTFRIEHLLRSYGEALAARRAQELPVRNTRFDNRSLLAGFLTVFIFAPGFATATVFLMQTEKNLPAINQPQPASKSSRMPLSQWRAKAIAPLADTQAVVSADVELAPVEPLAIRGTLQQQTLPTAVSAAAPAAAIASTRQRRRHEAPRAKPANLVAEAVVPEPAAPSFLEKLFALRTL